MIGTSSGPRLSSSCQEWLADGTISHMIKTAIVTGAAGFIGGHLLERLLSMGIDAAGVDDMSGAHPELLPAHVRDKIVTCDFTSANAIDALQYTDVIFHLAALPRVSFSVERPLETHVTNLHKTVTLLDAIRLVKQERRPRIVFASSSSVYGGAMNLPSKPEDATLFSQASPYAMQKAQCEMALRMYAKLYDVDCVSLRFFNVFGPRQLGDSAYATAIAAWMSAVSEGRALRCDGDGSQTRDMCYVSNVVDACILAGAREARFSGESLNVGCGERNSNAAILDWFRERYGDLVSVDRAPWRPGDVMHTHADISLTRSELGYEPRVDLWEGLRMTAEWHESRSQS